MYIYIYNIIYIYTASKIVAKIVKPMNILHEIPSESCQNPTTNSPSSNFSTTLGAWRNWRRSCRRSSSAARSTSPIGSPTSPGRNSELVQSHRNVIRIPSECHHELDGILWDIMGYDTLMKFWTSCHNHGYQHQLYQKIPI